MNLPIQSTASMSSREIAELTSKRHGDVMRDIRAMYEQLGESISASAYFDAQNKERREYTLDKSYSLLLVSGYSVPLRKAIIDRWEELENNAPALPDFSNPEVITGLLVTLQDTQQENNRLNRVCNDLAHQLTSGITAPQFAKLLVGVNSQQIQGRIIAMEHLKQTNGGALRGVRVTAKGRNSGYFVQKWTDKGDFKVGSAWVTERGAKWLYKLYQDDKLPMLKGWKGCKSPDLFLGDKPQLALVPTKSAEAV